MVLSTEKGLPTSRKNILSSENGAPRGRTSILNTENGSPRPQTGFLSTENGGRRDRHKILSSESEFFIILRLFCSFANDEILQRNSDDLKLISITGILIYQDSEFTEAIIDN